MNLIDLVHTMYKRDLVTIDIFNAVEEAFKNLEANITDIEKQGLLNFATWYLDIIENELGIVEKALTLDERREEVRLRLLTRGKVCVSNALKICKNYANYAAVVYNADKYTMDVTLSADITNGNYAKLKEQLRAYVPAHIRLDYGFYARKHSELKKFTHGGLKKFTHKELREKVELT